ncbi:MAG: TonB-dependent receptor, partial [Xanthomonadales bacterium]|nr:TonB-dependent receptor [Xanthomonadales bacterium]
MNAQQRGRPAAESPAPTWWLCTSLSVLLFSGLPVNAAGAPEVEAPQVLEEVLVTAQRREESLMQVPLAVSTVSGTRMDHAGAVDLSWLSQVTPNVSIEPARGTNNALSAYIRGVGQQDHIAGFESGVGLYVDDVYFNRPQLALLEVYDVQRVEILRGPQGTLYGRNSVGGAIKYVTRRPGEQAELRLRARVGSHGMQDTIVSGDLPLGDSLRMGGSVASLNLDGFGDNLFVSSQRNYHKEMLAARLTAEWTPADTWAIRVNGDWLQDDSDLRRGHRLLPGAYSGAPVLAKVFDSRAGNTWPVADAEAWGLSVLAEWAVDDAWTLRGFLAHREDETWKPVDLDGLPTVDVDVSTWDGNRQDT